MTASQFDLDTTVRRRSERSYEAEVSSRWSVGHRPNGGYLMALVARALADALAHPRPVTLTAHYASALEPGPATVAVEPLRVGRRFATGHAVLEQGERRCLLLVGTFAAGEDPAGAAGAEGGHLPTGLVVPGDGPPELPDPDACIPASGRMPDGTAVPLAGQFDLRLHPGTGGWARDAPSRRAEVGGWIRLADGRDADPYLLPVVVDAFPPTVFDLGYNGWVPTIELTVHLRAQPAPGWLRCWVRSRLLAGGYVEEDAEVWDAEGRLVAMSRQLALLPAGRTG